MPFTKGLSAFVEHLNTERKEAKMQSLDTTPYDNVLKMRTLVPKKTHGECKMKMLKIRSNFARGRVVSFDNLNIHFNLDGVAEVPEFDKEVIEGEMTRRPGRYSWVDESPVVVEEPEVVAPEEPEEDEDSIDDLEKEMTAVLDEVEDQPVSEVKKSPKSKKPLKSKK